MIAAKKDLQIRFGDVFRLLLRVRQRTLAGGVWVPGPYRDLTGWTILSQIRVNADSETVITTFTSTLGDQEDEELGRGSFTLSLSSETTAALRALSPIPSNAVYDVQLTAPSGDAYTYVEGKVTFLKDVSRV